MASVTLGITSLAVVGESNYQKAIKKANRAARPLLAELQPEPYNPYDANAVRVDLWVAGVALRVGYLNRSNAKRYQQKVIAAHMQGDRVVLFAQIFGGTRDQRTLGVWIGEKYA